MKDQLRDIKPLLPIPDYSYELFLGGAFLLLFLAMVALFFLVRKIYRTRQESLKHRYFKELKAVDWEDPKKAAYRVTFLARKLCEDKRSKEIFSQLLPMLEPFKYKKEVPEVDLETLQQYNLLVHVIDESL